MNKTQEEYINNLKDFVQNGGDLVLQLDKPREYTKEYIDYMRELAIMELEIQDGNSIKIEQLSGKIIEGVVLDISNAGITLLTKGEKPWKNRANVHIQSYVYIRDIMKVE